MPDAVDPTLKSSAAADIVPEAVAVEMRRLVHDLSNALEIIVQTSYLLGMADLQPPASEWLPMLDTGVEKAVAINQALRSYLKDHS